MGTIIPFPSLNAAAPRGRVQAPGEPHRQAEILIFTGVRYSRTGPEPGDGKPAATRSRRPRKRRSSS